VANEYFCFFRILILKSEKVFEGWSQLCGDFTFQTEKSSHIEKYIPSNTEKLLNTRKIEGDE